MGETMALRSLVVRAGTTPALAALLFAFTVAPAVAASAEVQCQDIIAQAARNYFRDRANAVLRCEDKKSAGRLEETVSVSAGSADFRIYVSADGLETETVSLTATLEDQASHVLRIIIAENGTASAQLN